MQGGDMSKQIGGWPRTLQVLLLIFYVFMGVHVGSILCLLGQVG